MSIASVQVQSSLVKDLLQSCSHDDRISVIVLCYCWLNIQYFQDIALSIIYISSNMLSVKNWAHPLL